MEIFVYLIRIFEKKDSTEKNQSDAFEAYSVEIKSFNKLFNHEVSFLYFPD